MTLAWRPRSSAPRGAAVGAEAGAGAGAGAGGGHAAWGEREGEAYARSARALKASLVALGPTYVKLGQNLANRPDLVQPDFMDELTSLQDQVPPFPDDEARRILREDLGVADEAEVFAELSPEPVAAASIAQVYRGRLRGSGADVAVKVQRPDVRGTVLLDLILLRWVAVTFLDGYMRRNLGCPASLLVDEFGEKILEELDFAQEALNLRDFRANFEGDPAVRIPRVFPEYCGERVVVMEWLDGVRCTAPGALRGDDERQAFIQCGVESALKQLLEFGLFHGDPHPGNVMAMPDGTVGYVDFGNVAEISRSNQETLIDAITHCMNDEYGLLAGDLQELGFLAEDADVGPIARELRDAWGSTLSGSGLSNFSFRRLTAQFNKLLFKYPIRVPERFSLVIRSLLTQEGICLTLDPEFQLLETAFPYVARRLLTDEDPALRMRLLQIVIVGGKFQWERLTDLVELAQSDARPGEPGMLARVNLVGVALDGLQLLAKDKTFRDTLLAGFKDEPWTTHAAEAVRLGALLARVLLQTWWARLAAAFGRARRLAAPAARPRARPEARYA